MTGREPRPNVAVTRGRPSRRRLHALVAERRRDRPTLVVHSHDLDHAALFPNRRHISPRAARPEDLRAEPPYGEALAAEPEGGWPMVVCTGLLEHVPDPAATVRALARALAPGGELILTGSGIFPFHGSRSYFHFGPDGMRALVEAADLELLDLQGSTAPIQTVASLSRRASAEPGAPLLQRVALRGAAALLEAAERLSGSGRGSSGRAMGTMPASLMAVARKPPR